MSIDLYLNLCSSIGQNGKRESGGAEDDLGVIPLIHYLRLDLLLAWSSPNRLNWMSIEAKDLFFSTSPVQPLQKNTTTLGFYFHEYWSLCLKDTQL